MISLTKPKYSLLFIDHNGSNSAWHIQKQNQITIHIGLV